MLMLLGITEPTIVVVNVFGNYLTMVDSGSPTYCGFGSLKF